MAKHGECYFERERRVLGTSSRVGGTDLLDKIEDGGIVWLEHVTDD